jgi:hypothetical protein
VVGQDADALLDCLQGVEDQVLAIARGVVLAADQAGGVEA